MGLTSGWIPNVSFGDLLRGRNRQVLSGEGVPLPGSGGPFSPAL